MLPPVPRIVLGRPRAYPGSNAEEEKKKRRAVLRYVLRWVEQEGDDDDEHEEGEGGTVTAAAENSDGMPSELFFQLLKMMGLSWYPVAEGAGSDGKV